MKGTPTMTSIETMTDAELKAQSVYGSYWEKEAARDELYRRADERTKRGRQIGDVIEFVRHAKPVEVSRNHRDGITEAGMSVYMLDGEEVVYVGFWFEIAQKPAYRGTGRIVGWGSDGEPVVEVIGTCCRARKFDRKG
jgi:hypothetical protein